MGQQFAGEDSEDDSEEDYDDESDSDEVRAP